MAFLTPDKTYTLYGLEIKEKLITSSSGVKYYSNRKLNTTDHKPEYITIHNTADIEEAKGTDDAEQYSRATFNNNMGTVVVHYYIDETSCWHILADDTVGWHAADGTNGPGNTKSVAIEIIMDGSGKDYDVKAEDRGALLAAILLHKYNLPIGKMKTHRDWYPQKYCPAYILPHWEKFVAKVQANLKKIEEADKPSTPTTTTELYRIRKSWSDASSQVRAYANLEAAKAHRDRMGEGYFVFDSQGNKIYPIKTTTTNTTGFKIGDTVKLTSDAVYTTGKAVPAWVKNSMLYVRAINGDNVTISTLKTGDITGVVNKKYLTAYEEFKPYTAKVTALMLYIRKGPGTSYGTNGVVRFGQVYTIVEEQNGFGKLKSGAGWVSLTYLKRT